MTEKFQEMIRRVAKFYLVSSIYIIRIWLESLTLHHWVRSGVEYTDYPYARFNISLDALDYYCLDDNNNDEIGDDDDYSDDDGYSEDESLEDINRKDGDEDGMKDKIEKENNGENNKNQKHLDGASISNTSIFTSSSIDKINSQGQFVKGTLKG